MLFGHLSDMHAPLPAAVSRYSSTSPDSIFPPHTTKLHNYKPTNLQNYKIVTIKIIKMWLYMISTSFERLQAAAALFLVSAVTGSTRGFKYYYLCNSTQQTEQRGADCPAKSLRITVVQYLQSYFSVVMAKCTSQYSGE